MTDAVIAQFAALFAGLTRAKGRYIVTPDPSQVAGDKAKGKATTVSELVTVEDYAKHLRGEQGLGIVPVRDDGTCLFGAIDIDQYIGIDHADLVKRAAIAGVSVSVCRSKSGGAHVYVFAAEPGVPAPQLIEHLKRLRTLLGIDGRKAREIFPKQKQQSGGIGNWINLPYFGDSPRKAIQADGTEYSLEEFLSTVQRIDLKSLTKTTGKEDATLVLTELPPCLERLVLEGIPPGMRNEALFSFTVFAMKKFKMDRPKVKAMVDILNNRACHPPLTQAEVNTTLESVMSHEYNYKCLQSPIQEVCNKDLCATRPYGPGASTRPGGMPEIERIEAFGDQSGETMFYIKLAVSPKLVACNSKVLTEYIAFKRAVLDTLHIMLPVVKQTHWEAYLAARFQTLNVTMRAASERTKRGLVLMSIEDWIHSSGSTDPNLFAVGRPFIDGQSIFIAFGELGARLRHVIPTMDLSTVARMLEEAGWEKTSKTIGGRTHDNVWVRSIDASTAVPDTNVPSVKEVDGHIVMEAPPDMTSHLVEELTWDQIDLTQEGQESV